MYLPTGVLAAEMITGSFKVVLPHVHVDETKFESRNSKSETQNPKVLMFKTENQCPTVFVI
jgi:hypothetical protein